MTPPLELPLTSMELDALRTDYESGNLSKLKYNGEMWNIHRYLFEYSRFLRGTNVAAIDITDESVVFVLREPRIRLRCTPLDQRHVAVTTLNFRQYESRELKAVMRLTKACDVFYDVGANTGFYSIAVAQRFPHAKVVAFEPIRSTYLELKHNLELNSIQNVITHNIGLANHPSEAPFYFDATVPGATSGAPLGPEFANTETVICPVDTLDRFTARTGTYPDFIKCDVEGGELRVFEGATTLIERHKPMIFTEMLRKWSARFGYHPNDIIAFFRERGYECFILSDNVLEPFSEMTDGTIETNFFFLHTRRHLDMVRFIGLLHDH